MVAVLAFVVASAPAGVAPPSAPSDYRAVVDDYRSGRKSALDAIMHTEAWSVALRDQRNDAARIHLEASIRLLQRVRDLAPTQSDFIDRWRVVVSGLLRKTVNKGLADDFDQRTAPSFPANPARQAAMRSFLLGLEAERDASAVLGPSDFIGSASSDMRQRSWASAPTSYQEALQRNPNDTLILLHIGRVRMHLHAWAHATQDFTRAKTADDPRVRYLALLFLGSIAERDGKYKEAEQSYLAAMETYPLGQAWSLALSQLLSRTGREPEARKAIEVLGSRKGNLVEPLWTYLPPPSPDVVDLQMSFNELRAEVAR